MVYGIGVDAVQVERMAKSLARASFMRRVFSADEQALLAGITAPEKRAQTAAANFAAKEAFLKATGRGIGGFALSDMAALRQESGKPYFRLAGEAAVFCMKNNLLPMLSLTHEGGLAMAFVVLERQ